MSYRSVEDKTQGNQTAERYLGLLQEYGTFEDRMAKALAHKEAFSEKVLAKVTGEYKSRMDQLSKERSILEAQLRSELAGFEKQLQAILPARQRYHEEIEELELRHLTGELPTKEYTKRKAALEAQKLEGAASDILQKNVEYYRQVLHGGVEAFSQQLGEEAYEAPAENLAALDHAPAQGGWQQDDEAEDSLPELEDEPPYAIAYEEQPAVEDEAPFVDDEAPFVDDEGPFVEDEAPFVEDEAPFVEEEARFAGDTPAVPGGWDESGLEIHHGAGLGEPGVELGSEEDYFAAQLSEPELDTEGSYFEPVAPGAAEERVEDAYEAEHLPVEEEAEYYDPAAVAEELDADDGFYAEVAEDELGHDGFELMEGAPEAQEEEEFFQSEFDETSQAPADPNWYAAQGRGAAPAPGGRLEHEAAGALDDIDEFAEAGDFVGDDVEIPEELLMDDDEEFLQQEPIEDSAALLQSTNRLLDDESFEDVFDEELGDPDTGSRALEPALVLREGMPEEKIFYMTNNLLTIGRGPDNDIQLSTDTSVSRHHSRITYEDDEYWISDLGSSNGTIVNGARVSKTVLTGDDEISIGQTVLKFKFC